MKKSKKYYALIEFIVEADNCDIPDTIESDIEDLIDQEQINQLCDDVDISYSKVISVKEETLPCWKHIVEFKEHEYVALREFMKECKKPIKNNDLQNAFNRILGE